MSIVTLSVSFIGSRHKTALSYVPLPAASRGRYYVVIGFSMINSDLSVSFVCAAKYPPFKGERWRSRQGDCFQAIAATLRRLRRHLP